MKNPHPPVRELGVEPVASKRIDAIQPMGQDGSRWAVGLDFSDGDQMPPPGVIANHPAARSCAPSPLPTRAVFYSVLRDNGTRRRRPSDQLLATGSHYAEAMRACWDSVEERVPNAWLLAGTRRYGVDGTLTSNRRLMGQVQIAGGHAFIAQPEANATAESILDMVETLREYQASNPPPVGNEIDVLAHVPYRGTEDNDLVEHITLLEHAFFIDLHGTGPGIITGMRELNETLNGMRRKPWIGATQVPVHTNGKSPVLTSSVLNVLGVMGCVPRLGAPFSGTDEGLALADKKKWAVRNTSRCVDRSDLPPGTMALAPQASGLDLSDGDAVDAVEEMYEVYRGHSLFEGASEAALLFDDVARKRVDANFLAKRPALKAIVG